MRVPFIIDAPLDYRVLEVGGRSADLMIPSPPQSSVASVAAGTRLLAFLKDAIGHQAGEETHPRRRVLRRGDRGSSPVPFDALYCRILVMFEMRHVGGARTATLRSPLGISALLHPMRSVDNRNDLKRLPLAGFADPE